MARNNKVDAIDANWFIFAGFSLIGLGIGISLDGPWAGLLIGAGVGFLAMVVAPYIKH